MGNKKCRIYAACGVSQTPISLTTEGKRFVEEKIYPVMEMENSIFDELTEQESEEYLRLVQKITCMLREKMNHR